MKRVLIIAASALLVGCGPSSGVIINKHFEPAHYEQRQEYRCYSYNQQGICSVGMHETVQDYYPDHWSLHLENCKTEKDCDRGWKKVSSDVYDRAKVGYFYDSKTGKLEAR